MVSFNALSALALAATALAQGFYKNTPVLELDPSNFDQVVLTNQTAIVEFYAPWCGHCRNLQSEYLKVGRHLQDLAIVGAVNCDDQKNKQLCAKYRVEGFPTLIVFRPPKVNLEKATHRNYAHATETYQGPRKAKAMVDFVTDRMKNYTKRFATLGKLEEWAQKDTGRPKVVVLTRKDRLTTFLKSLATDFLEKADFAYVPLRREKSADVFEKFDVDPEGDKSVLMVFDKGEWIKYDGELTKSGIVEFLGQFTDVEDLKERQALLKSVMKGEKMKKQKKKGKKSKSKKASHDEL